jgi:hypothetical protein
MPTLYKLLLIFIYIGILQSCKPENNLITLSPNLNETAYSYNIADTTLVLDSALIKSFDLDKDGIVDIEFYLEERNSAVLKQIDIRVQNSFGTKILGRETLNSICKDSILFIEYQFYIYRLYNCNSLNPERIDSSFCAYLGSLEELQHNINHGQFLENAIIFYDKEYFPVIFPGITSEDIQKGEKPSENGSYILLKKNDKLYLVKLKWDRPFFIIEELRILAG